MDCVGTRTGPSCWRSRSRRASMRTVALRRMRLDGRSRVEPPGIVGDDDAFWDIEVALAREPNDASLHLPRSAR